MPLFQGVGEITPRPNKVFLPVIEFEEPKFFGLPGHIGRFGTGKPMTRKIQAIVFNTKVKAKHALGTLGPDGPKSTGELSKSFRVEIVFDELGAFMLRYDKNGDFCGDTWHQTIEEAKAQASFEFNTNEADWVEVE